MLPPRRQPSFLDFSDVKMVLKIDQKSDLKSSPRGGPPIRAEDLEGVDAAGKEKSQARPQGRRRAPRSVCRDSAGSTPCRRGRTLARFAAACHTDLREEDARVQGPGLWACLRTLGKRSDSRERILAAWS